MSARIVAVCIGPGGIPKHPVVAARVTTSGLEGDHQRFRLHGGPKRAVCLFSSDDYASLVRDGVSASTPGSYGENVLIEGLDFAGLRPGNRLRLGAEAVIELTDVREPCGTLKSLDRRFPNLLLGRSGFVCSVVREGLLRSGDPVEVLAG
jgi:MOSC domain-containing protein YiiM